MHIKSKILDCTIRDGGYYNKWNFSDRFVSEYLKLMSKLNIDWVEIGFRKQIENKSYGKYIKTEDSVLQKINIPKNISLAVMIDSSDFKTSEQLIKLSKIFKSKKKSKISMVRIATSFEDLYYLKNIIKILKRKNYLISVNLMKFTLLKKNQIIKFFSKVKHMGADYFYLADSFGNCLPKNLYKISKLLIKKFDISKFGYHGHNNFNLAHKNAIVVKKLGFGLIDTSINGMGRGAGNLLLEDFTKNKLEFKQSKSLKSFIRIFMKKLKKEYRWGPSYPYFFSAKHNIHPTFIQNLLNEKKFLFKDIFSILNFLKSKDSKKFDPNVFDNFFLKTNPIKKNSNINLNKEINLYCNNPTIDKIKINSKDSFKSASLNFNKYVKSNHYDFLFICHPYRLMTEFKTIQNLNKKIILPNFNILNINEKKDMNLNFYNYYFSDKFFLNKNYCRYNKNLVLIFALSYCIVNNVEKINLYGLSKNDENKKIIKFMDKYLKNKKLNSKILVK